MEAAGGREAGGRVQHAISLGRQAENQSQGGEVQIKGQAQEAKIKAESADKQIKIIQEQLELDEGPGPAGWDHHDLGAAEDPEGPPGRDRHGTAPGRGGRDGDWEMEVDVPDDDMGPILEAQSKLQKEIDAGTKPAGSTLEAYFVTATDPEHKLPRLRPADRGQGRDGRGQARRQGDRRLQRQGPQRLPRRGTRPSAPAPRSAPGSSAARPGWPTSCSATSSTSSTRPSCSAGRS